jgi:hypothetical protein
MHGTLNSTQAHSGDSILGNQHARLVGQRLGICQRAFSFASLRQRRIAEPLRLRRYFDRG